MAPTDLLAFGEPTHLEPAFAWTRNDLFAELAGHGYRSIALETDRVAALVVDDYVRYGTGTLDIAMARGFSHGFGDFAANRGLVAWMREYIGGPGRADTFRIVAVRKVSVRRKRGGRGRPAPAQLACLAA
ncbi:MAG: hypothetical protein HOQ36_25730 [Nocardia sp.]|nr:hypothetical protein [Nocardia sp.]